MKKAAVPSILVGVVLLALGVTAEAQQPKKVPRIGYLSILLKNPHFLFLIDAKNALDSNMKVARDKFSSTLVLTRENKLLLALKRGSESAFSSERRAD
jgi:hypothetical protein